MPSKCFANLDKCSRGTDDGWHICVPCYRALEDKEDYELLDRFKPEKVCHYPGCWNRQLEASLYCKGVKHQQVRADRKWSEDKVSSMIYAREGLEQARGRAFGVETFIGGSLAVRNSLKRSSGSADRDDQSNMAVKDEPLENMEVNMAMQCIDRMNEIELAAIVKHAITQLQAKLPLRPEPIKLHSRQRTRL